MKIIHIEQPNGGAACCGKAFTKVKEENRPFKKDDPREDFVLNEEGATCQECKRLYPVLVHYNVMQDFMISMGTMLGVNINASPITSSMYRTEVTKKIQELLALKNTKK